MYDEDFTLLPQFRDCATLASAFKIPSLRGEIMNGILSLCH